MNFGDITVQSIIFRDVSQKTSIEAFRFLSETEAFQILGATLKKYWQIESLNLMKIIKNIQTHRREMAQNQDQLYRSTEALGCFT